MAKCPFRSIGKLWLLSIEIVVEVGSGKEQRWGVGRWGSWYIEHYVLCMSASNCRVAAHSHQRIPTCMQRSLSSPLSFSSFFSHLSLPTRLSFVLIILHKKLIISIFVFFFYFFCCCLSCSPSLVDKFFVIFGVRRFYLVLKLNTICFRYCCCCSSCHTFSY